jgi:hypothetical protein
MRNHQPISRLTRAERTRRARALRRRIAHLERERADKAHLALWLDAQMHSLLDELHGDILRDGVALSQLRSAANRLEFTPVEIDVEVASWAAARSPAEWRAAA